MNMKQFDYYEFAGIVVPGALTVAGILVFFKIPSPPVEGYILLLMVAYILGQLQQEVGYIVDFIWWLYPQKDPSDFLPPKQKNRHHVLQHMFLCVLEQLSYWLRILVSGIKLGGEPYVDESWMQEHKTRLETCIAKLQDLHGSENKWPDYLKIPPEQWTRFHWKKAKRDIEIQVFNSAQVTRFDIFNGTMSMARGICMSLLILFGCSWMVGDLQFTGTDKVAYVVPIVIIRFGLVIVFFIFLIRMDRYTKSLSNQLYYEFMNIDRSKHSSVDSNSLGGG